MGWGHLKSLNPNVPDIDLVTEVTLDKKKPPISDSTTQRNKLSSPHCKVYQKDGLPFIEDLGSRNGTFVNGQKLSPNIPLQLVSSNNITLSIPNTTHPQFDINRHFAFTFLVQTNEEKTKTNLASDRRKKRGPSKFDTKTKLVASRRGVSAVAGTGRSFSTNRSQSLETPEDYVAQLRFKPSSRVLEDLEESIKKNNAEWLESFLSIGGLSTVLRELEVRFQKSVMNNLDKLISYHAIKVIYQVMQDPEGFRAILSSPNGLGIIALGLASDHVKIQVLVPMLLAAVACISRDGHKEVLEAMNYYKKQKNERVRFKGLVTSLKTEDDTEYKTNVLRLINAIISKFELIEDRTAMRHEFKSLGLVDIMEGLRYEDEPSITSEIDGFFDEMEEDSKESMINNVDLSDPVSITAALMTQTHGKALQYFKEIMQQLFSIPVGSPEALGTWRLAEDVIRSSCAPEETNKKTMPKKLDFKTIRQMKKTAAPSDLLQQDQDAMRGELEGLQEQIKQMKLAHLEEVNNLMDQNAKDKKELQQSLETEIASLRDRLESAAKPVVDIIPSTPVTVLEPTETIVNDAAPPPPPPGIGPPPMGGMPPPPPGMGPSKTSHADKYPFKPTVQMKKFYWKPVRAHELTETVWEKVDFTSVQYIEPIELEKLFGAKKKAEEKAAKEKEEENPFQNMIDLKRSNNIGIMLKHFKLSPSAIQKAIVDVDETILTPEKISQLYRNAPTPEENELLSFFTGDPRELGKSEQFLLQLVSIPDVTERLELLQFRSVFDDESEDLKHHYNTVITGVEQVLQSTLLHRVCELILAVGNMMNYGQWKPPTIGFKVDFLTKVADTRCGDNSLNMVHYLTGLVADKNPELLKLSDELDMIGNASRIPVAKLNSDVAKMNNTMSQIKRLLKKDAENPEMSRFREVLLSFSLHAKRELEIIADMKNKLQDLGTQFLRFYPFASTLPIEESLGVISEFVLMFMKCHNDNEQEQANREMKERMAKKREEREAAQSLKKKQRATRPKKGLMDGAMATIRGGGMKTFRAKRGQPMNQSLEELALEMEKEAEASVNRSSNPVVADDPLMEQLKNSPQPIEPEPEPIVAPEPVIETTEIEPIPVLEEQDSAALLEDMLANDELLFD